MMSDVESIERLEAEILSAIEAKDGETLAGLLSPDFVYRSPGIPDRNRDAFLDLVRAIPGEIETICAKDLHARILGDAAVVTGVQVARVRFADGSLVESRVAFTDVFQRDGGQWLLSLAFGVELPTGDAALV